MPAAEPATRSVLRSEALKWMNCAMSDPNAPPVMMIGPSAPNGPPEPIAMAAESGLRIASLGSTRLPLMRIDSMASGMPCPRILSEPQRAMTPTIKPPMTGTMITPHPSMCAAGDAGAKLNRWKKKMFVKKAISLSSATATYDAITPIPIASADSRTTRRSVV
jgi:hypothetical protein